jgi:sec-independent protein translocase protein TatC
MEESTEKKRDEREMPFLDHLEELRWRIIKSLIAVAIGALAAYYFSDRILAVLIAPYQDALQALAANGNDAVLPDISRRLIFLSPTEGFLVRIKVALFAGFLLALPVVFYQTWKFIAPGLLNREERYLKTLVTLSVFCFAVGSLFCYFVILRFGLRFLLGFETSMIIAAISISKYLGFVTMLLLVFGLVFELPVLTLVLAKMGLLTPPFMRHYRRYAYVLFFVFAAIITPPDVFTQLMLAGPLILLYEVSIWIAGLAAPKPSPAS